MKKLEVNEKGISLVALMVTIIVLSILAGITISGGVNAVKRATLEGLKTNMMLIEAKARECVEEVNFKLGPNNQKIDEIASIRESVYETSAGLEKAQGLQIDIPSEIHIDETVYLVTEDTMEKWGISKIKLEEGEVYLIKFDETNLNVEIYNNLGFEGKYSLTELNEIEI